MLKRVGKKWFLVYMNGNILAFHFRAEMVKRLGWLFNTLHVCETNGTLRFN